MIPLFLLLPAPKHISLAFIARVFKIIVGFPKEV